MEKFIKYVTSIVANSTLEEKEKNKLLQFIEMVKKDVEDAQKSEKLHNRQKNCFYKAYKDCLIYACICFGIEDVNEQISNLYAQKVIVGESGYELIKRNYSKMAMISKKIQGNNLVIVDDGKEYKSLCENLGIEYICQDFENKKKQKTSDHIDTIASRLLNPLLEGALPEEMNDKLAVFRTPTISQCIVCDSIEDISNITKE